MRFMNYHDIAQAARKWENHPVLGPATRTMQALESAADSNSDGWAYYPAPARAAAKLMELIERDGTGKYAYDDKRPDATAEELKAALIPVRAFRTRSGWDFEIYDGTDADGEAMLHQVQKDLAAALGQAGAALRSAVMHSRKIDAAFRHVPDGEMLMSARYRDAAEQIEKQAAQVRDLAVTAARYAGVPEPG